MKGGEHMDWLPFDENEEEMSSSKKTSSENIFEEEREVDYWEVNGNSIGISAFTEALIEALCK